jgi:DNA-binding GntR family transcriptional regulator
MTRLKQTPLNLTGANVRLTLQERTYQAIKKALLSGELIAGQSLTVREIAESMGTSPTPVREAVRRLLTEGAFELLPNGTVRVRQMNDEQRQHARDIRIMLEGLAARRAAALATPEEIDAIERTNDEMKSAILRGDVKRYCLKNMEFHFQLYQAARSEVVFEIIERLWVQISPFLTVYAIDLLGRQPKKVVKVLTTEHDRIIRALRRRDGDEAESAIRSDLSQTFEGRAKNALMPDDDGFAAPPVPLKKPRELRAAARR